jgi:predicted transposase YdaD
VNQYDIALKSLLQRQLQGGFLSRFTGHRITEWLGTELPEVHTRHVDLLGKTAEGQLVHIEFQSRNHPRMALRMAEYALAIYRRLSGVNYFFRSTTIISTDDDNYKLADGSVCFLH